MRLTSGIKAIFQLVVQIINNIFVSNFLFFYFIQNPSKAITMLSGALYSANVKLVKTTILDMGITIEIIISNNVIRRVQPPFTKLLMVRFLVVLAPT